jgi:hypothetical protein
VNDATSLVHREATRAAYGLKTIVARYPSIALPMARARGRGEVLTDDTDIAIESFPRCASSFAVAAFRLAQEPRPMKIANHTHMPAQVIAAIRRGIPAVVLVREPEDTILSHLIRSPDLSPRGALRGYLRFYEPLVRHREGFVVGTFQDVIHDFGSVIRRVNARFGTSFTEFEHTPANLERLSREIEEDYRPRTTSDEELERIIPRPSGIRDGMKEELHRRYRAEIPAALRRRAEAVHGVLTA